MKIIIPLASNDKDFENKYGKIKHLCNIGFKPMIENFVNHFKFNYEYIFLCKNKDIIETNLLDVINKLKIKKKKIIPIKKDTTSAIETLFFADPYVGKNEDVLIAHPDGINIFFSKSTLIKKLNSNKIDGLIFAFDEDVQTNTSETHTGRLIYKNNKIIKIVEKSIKSPDTKRMAGIYFFKKWSEFMICAKETFINQSPVRGRYFISQIYNEYIKKRKKIDLFLIKKHVAFGIVSYVDEYNFWHKYFKFNYNKSLKIKFDFINLIPTCGNGERFLKEKSNSFKPLVNVDEKTMIEKTIDSLPRAKKNIIIIRKDHDKKYNFSKYLNKTIKNSNVLILNKKTSGMASTCYEAVKDLPKKTPLLISSCDYSLVFDEKKFLNLINYLSPDVIVWAFKNYPDARLSPFAYAYLEIKNGIVKKISEKVPISNNPHEDHIAQGIFYFKSAEIFIKAANQMFSKKNMVNNEYYVANSINELIRQNYKILPFQVDQYICLGTPRDLSVYKFWYSFFK